MAELRLAAAVAGIITPPDLMKYGEVIYWSGKRTDPQVLDVATSRTPKFSK